jgi:hypothetical protein
VRRKWSGTLLFAAILVVMGATIGLKLYGSGLHEPVVTTSTPQPQADSRARTTSSPGTGGPTAPVPTTTPARAPQTVAGEVVQTPYGPIQVSVTFVGRTITSVKELRAPSDRGRSIEINRYAEPLLQREVLKTQSAHVDAVSGATYTSQGYARSVQSAIDRL